MPKGGPRVAGPGKKIGRPVGGGTPRPKPLQAPKPGDTIQTYLARWPDHDPFRIVMRYITDESIDLALRVPPALGLMPFCHPKMSTVSLHKTVEPPSREVIDRLRDLMMRATSNPIIDVTPAREVEPTADVVELRSKGST
jgi:hypothetical protein